MADLTNGELAVGKSFNPSQDETVAKLKALFAETFDVVESATNLEDVTHRKLRDAALHEIVSAQMWAVKVATWQLGK